MDKHIIGKLNESVRLGKLSLGVDFALEKVLGMTSMPPNKAAEMAQATLDKVKCKNIHLPSYLNEVLQKASKLSAKAADGPP
eukprot:2745151-Lingulodinium_polyedra.AAC.1